MKIGNRYAEFSCGCIFDSKAGGAGAWKPCKDHVDPESYMRID